MSTTRKAASYWIAVMLIVLVAAPLFVPVANAQDGDEPQRTGFRPDAPPYGVRGPNLVGVQEFVLDADSERPLIGSIWYPALNPDDQEESATYDIGLADVAPGLNVWHGRAIWDAAPDRASGPYPLIVFSPGYGGTRYYGSFMHDHLASHGFVVMAVDHTGNTLAGNMSEPDVVSANRYASMIYRPQDVSRQIDYAETLNSGEMQGLLDLDNIGVYGISFGGYTALMAGGAQLDMAAFSNWCAEFPEDTHQQCPVLERQDDMAALAGLDTVPEGIWPSLGDPRVDVIVPMVPGMSAAIGPQGAQGIAKPVMLVVSGADQEANPERLATLFENIQTEKTMVWFENAGHYLFGGLCPEAWQAFPIYCLDPVWDLDRAHDLYNHFLAAYFSAHLKGDAEAAAALAPDAMQFPGITYETTGF